MTKSSFLIPSGLLLLVVLAACSPVLSDCEYAHGAAIKLILQTQRNATGHRNLKVTFETRAEMGGAADLGALEAIQPVSVCDGVEIVSTTSTITASPVGLHNPDYELFPGLGYYKFHSDPVTWDQAYHICRKEGSLLMMVDSEAESSVVKQFLGRKVTVTGPTWANWMWLGFHDKGVEGEYLTVEGTKVKEGGFTKWDSGQPDNAPWGTEPDQDCGGINNAAQMEDLPCLAKLPFICEQRI